MTAGLILAFLLGTGIIAVSVDAEVSVGGAVSVGDTRRGLRPRAVLPGPPDGFRVERIAPGVYAVIRKEPPGFAFESNSVFIVGGSDVVVVDAQSSLNSTRQVLAALRRVTDKPVRYVINTHWHFDHVTGNQVYRDSFPGVEFIAHAHTREYMTANAAADRKKFLAAVPDAIDMFQGFVAQDTSFDGTPLTAEERTSYLSDIALAQEYRTVPADLAPTLPTRTFGDRTRLRQGDRTIDIRFLGRGHTGGDVIVHLPREDVVIAGDLVVWPVPLVGTTSFPIDFGRTLERLRALGAAVVVPGHGPVMRDDSYLRVVIDLLTSLREQAEAAVARGETLEEAQKSVNLDRFRQAVAGDSKLRGALFSNYVARPGVLRVYEQASGKTP